MPRTLSMRRVACVVVVLVGGVVAPASAQELGGAFVADWQHQSLLDSPAKTESSQQCAFTDTCVSRPLSETERTAIKGQSLIGAPVIVLFPLGSPSAVAVGVRPVILDSLDGMFGGWARSHVAVERLETVPPVVRDGNAATSVPMVGSVIRIRAATDQGDPSSVFRWILPTRQEAVGNKPLAKLALPFRVTTTATRRRSTFEVLHSDDFFTSAITEAFETGVLANLADVLSDGQPTKTTTNELICTKNRHSALYRISGLDGFAGERPPVFPQRLNVWLIGAGDVLSFLEILASEVCIQSDSCYEANRILPNGTGKWGTVGRALIKGTGTFGVSYFLVRSNRSQRPRDKWLVLAVASANVAWQGYLSKRALDRFPSESQRRGQR